MSGNGSERMSVIRQQRKCADWVMTESGFIALDELLANFVPDSPVSWPQPWTWDDMERELFLRTCLCCGEVGHHQRVVEAHVAAHGLTEGVVLGTDGRVRDGHHRIVAAKRLGVRQVPLESPEEAGARWVRDHGHVAWEDRTRGDCVTVPPARICRAVQRAAGTHSDEEAERG